MSFLAPFFLFGLGAIAIPIVIHLIQRERKRVVEFPSLMFIRRIPYQTDGLRTMPVVAYKRAFGHLPDRKGFEPDGAWIDFAGPPRTLTTVSFSPAHSAPGCMMSFARR